MEHVEHVGKPTEHVTEHVTGHVAHETGSTPVSAYGKETSPQTVFYLAS